ncbi:alanine--tRNA ligase [Actinomycetota bacterium]|nr:alanine--tRNA ligase [Actinomycetota bacterium]
MKTAELREKYLTFFESKGCKRVPSSSLIPDDPSMLLTSAGMVQFKPYFLQQKQFDSDYIGATTVQKCVRTTDIDIIGTTGRHLSFFEMMGNFSFGEYFKDEMCAWAYEFATDVLGFDPERLYFTVYLDDDETIEIWKKLGVPANHITKLGKEDNFWTAGATGPCGPCSELYYDQGQTHGCGSPDCAPGCDCDRFLEFWNCVFTQYDMQEDGSLVPLPKKNIDTGLGLERTAAILQGVQSNYETDMLRGLIAVGEQLSGVTYQNTFGFNGQGTLPSPEQLSDLSLRIVADHSRAVTFMIGDGILPSNEGKGYVLRRLLRRAMRHGQLLGIEPPFLSNFTQAVIVQLGGVYPELQENQKLIERIVQAEEERFAQTLRQGQNYLDGQLENLSAFNGQLSGAVAFELHDRFGFPIDLTIEIAAEQGIEVDRDGFEQQMEAQRQRARAHASDDAWGSEEAIYHQILSENGATAFVGYSQGEANSEVIAIIVNGQQVNQVSNGTAAQVVLNRTPFYGEMGGQVGDTGTLTVQPTPVPALVAGPTSSAPAVFTVQDTKVYAGGIYVHIGNIDGNLNVGDKVVAAIDSMRRERIERNHTATHLLHHALQEILGEHIKQAGSLVAPDRLRFDFTHFEPVSPAQLREVEQLVNTLVMEDSTVSSYETSLSDARQSGVTALFGEKYGEQVRVLEAGPSSRELCGGTHVSHTAQIGLIKIVSESSVGASLRRIEAITSFDALEYLNREEAELRKAAGQLKTTPFELVDKIESTQAKLRELEAELAALKKSSIADDLESYLKDTLDVGYKLVVTRVPDIATNELRDLADQLRQKLGKASAVVLGTIQPNGAPMILAASTKEATDKGFDAGALIKEIAPLIDGRGGGKPQMAQAGGKTPSGLESALEAAKNSLVA